MAYEACYGGLHWMYGLGFDQYGFLKADSKSDGFVLKVAFNSKQLLDFKLTITIIIQYSHHNKLI